MGGKGGWEDDLVREEGERERKGERERGREEGRKGGKEEERKGGREGGRAYLLFYSFVGERDADGTAFFGESFKRGDSLDMLVEGGRDGRRERASKPARKRKAR